MTVIDVHAHWMPLQFAEHVAAAARTDANYARRFGSLLGPLQDRLTNIRQLLDGMDAAGVDRSLVSVPPPAAAVPCGLPTSQVAKDLNDALIENVGTYPDRLQAVINVPPADVDLACLEVQRWADDDRVAGVCVPVGVGGAGIDMARFEPLYRLCADAALPVFLHPDLDEPSPQFNDWNLHSALGAPFATTIAAARLVLSGVLDRLPSLTLVLPHLGGAIPFLLGRLTEQTTPHRAVNDLSHYFRERMYYDTCAFHPPALHCAITTIGAQRLLLGSDYPFRGPTSRAVTELVGELDGAERDGTLGGHAQQLLMARTAQIGA